jgi:hypothetical protein
MKKARLIQVSLAAFALLAVAGCGRMGTEADLAPTSKAKAPAGLPSFAVLQAALNTVVDGQNNGGFGLEMWATTINRDGVVSEVTYSGEDRFGQWAGSRAISAIKANTANAFSLSNLALSTANLYTPTQPGGSLYGLHYTNPVDTNVVYGGNEKNYGTKSDPMKGRKPGGMNTFGGGLALYNSAGVFIGALGVSGDSSCADHAIAWKLRHALNLDNIPGGVNAGTDNILYDLNGGQTEGWEHPLCNASAGETAIAAGLTSEFPVGPTP